MPLFFFVLFKCFIKGVGVDVQGFHCFVFVFYSDTELGIESWNFTGIGINMTSLLGGTWLGRCLLFFLETWTMRNSVHDGKM